LWALLTSCWKTIVKPTKPLFRPYWRRGRKNFTHDHIAAQARRTPDALAVSSDETLTTQQLNDRQTDGRSACVALEWGRKQSWRC